MDRKELARRRALRVLEILSTNIADDRDVSRSDVAAAVGIAPSSLYRWLGQKPQKIDLIQIATLADYLHEAYGHEDFAAIWRRVEREIDQ